VGGGGGGRKGVLPDIRARYLCRKKCLSSMHRQKCAKVTHMFTVDAIRKNATFGLTPCCRLKPRRSLPTIRSG